MKYDKFFELAKAAGIEEAEISVYKSYSLSFSLFHEEIDSYKSSTNSSFLFRGIYKGKMGSFGSDIYNNNLAQYIVDQIVSNASVIENDDPVFIFKGSEKYRKINTFNKQLSTIPVEKKMEIAREIEKKIKASDPRITEIEDVGYSEGSSVNMIMNSHGLKLSQKNNYFYYYADVVMKENGQTKTGGELYFDNDFSKFDVDDFVKKVVKDASEQLGGYPCESATYKAVIDRQVVKSLIDSYIASACAGDVQKKSSLFVNKLGQKVASKKVTIEDLPLAKTMFARSFDDEGVATYNKAIIKNGILQTYLYNLTTAAKDGVQTTANGAVGGGSKVYTSTWFLRMKSGKKTLEQLFEEIGNGVYITSVSGLHAGMNSRSGNFSLQSTGFLIENGKKSHPLDIITISGNLVDLFNSITEVGSDSNLFSAGIECPSVIVKKLNVTGK